MMAKAAGEMGKSGKSRWKGLKGNSVAGMELRDEQRRMQLQSYYIGV